MDIQKLIRKDLRSLVPYEPHPYSNVIKLDANENPHSFPAELIEKLFSGIDGEMFNRYPDPLGEELIKKIALISGFEPENIILGNGSDELIQLLLQTFGGPGRKAVIPVPTFSMYKIHSQITGTGYIEVPRDASFGIDSEVLLKELADPDATVTFIASPNNPTGNAAPESLIESIVQNAQGLIVIDEAYIDFGGRTCVNLIDKYPNVIIMRTFSKIGLAGLRVGYLIASNQIINELLKVKQPYNVNSFSQFAASMVLDNWPLFKKQIDDIVSERNRLSNEMSGMPGITVHPSEANFILFSAQKRAEDVHRGLLEGGVLVRKNLGNTHGLSECLRVTVGTREENNVFLEKLRSIVNSQ